MGFFIIILYGIMAFGSAGGAILFSEGDREGAINCFAVVAIAFGVWLAVML